MNSWFIATHRVLMLELRSSGISKPSARLCECESPARPCDLRYRIISLHSP